MENVQSMGKSMLGDLVSHVGEGILRLSCRSFSLVNLLPVSLSLFSFCQKLCSSLYLFHVHGL